jgi:siroheme synthase (precorrin-2 oxidase/ferrochelatase)
VRVNISDAVKRADAIMNKIDSHLSQNASTEMHGRDRAPQNNMEFVMTNRTQRLKDRSVRQPARNLLGARPALHRQPSTDRG